MGSAYTFAFGIALLSFSLLYFRRRPLGREPLPPSPPTDSLIGHLRMTTAKHPELVLHEWAQEFGDIFCTKILGNGAQTAIDLLEDRSLNYSGRPRSVVFELAGWTSSVAFMQPGDRFKKQRKLYQQYFSRAKSKLYQPIQQDEARNLIKNLLEDTGDHDKHTFIITSSFSASIVIRIAYGHQISSEDDSYNIMSHQVAVAVDATGPAASTMVDFFPFPAVRDLSSLSFPHRAGWTSSVAFMQPGDRFKKQRKLYQQYFSRAKSKLYQPIQQDEARNLIKNLLEDTGDHDKHTFIITSSFSASIVIRIAYGHQISSEDDSYNIMSHQVAVAVDATGPAASTMVDFFPFLQYLPSWFPGTYFATQARRVRKCIRDLHEQPIEDIRQQIAAGIGSPCFVRNELENLPQDQAAGSPDYDTQLDDIMGAAATIYTAGADTTWTTMSIFLLAMVLYPDVQRKAQEEIDAVITSKRLPSFNDQGNLPYVNCVIQETMRWHPAVPLGIPHSTLEADIYNRMYIPKGALVFGNVWSMTHDPNVYRDPDTFDPSRFLPKPEGNGEPHPVGVFGFGRRICPGQYLAEASVWIGIATILSQLDISRAVDENGVEVIPKLEFTSSITRYLSGPTVLDHTYNDQWQSPQAI
ncbi:cytochrome P450 [Infundibulicybe gibba]|nr:cytochrome P450 [Infundibulicybe gibba]